MKRPKLEEDDDAKEAGCGDDSPRTGEAEAKEEGEEAASGYAEDDKLNAAQV